MPIFYVKEGCYEMPRNAIISLFTGAGGFDLGFHLSGHFRTAVALDSQEQFCDTLRDNQSRGFFEDTRIIEADLRERKDGSINRDQTHTPRPSTHFSRTCSQLVLHGDYLMYQHYKSLNPLLYHISLQDVRVWTSSLETDS